MSVLHDIVRQKRSDLARKKRLAPESGLERRLNTQPQSLARALNRPGRRFILELKPASPSAGKLRPEFDVQTIAASYDGIADAVSVLTESRWFHGSLENLAAARARLQVPLLCKDFIVDPYQVVEARAYGADAILLMLSLLDDTAWLECSARAASHGMEVLTEVHDEAERDRALQLGASIIGINNRNLATLEVDLETTCRLAPGVPRHIPVVAESGIRSRSDVSFLAPYASRFLVGSAIMQSADTGFAARTLVHGSVKICGLTRSEDARLAYRLGATYGGIIFAPGSPRMITEQEAAGIRRGSPLRWVGVFSDAPPREVATVAGRLGLFAVQLHGGEGAEQIRELRVLLPPGCEIWKAFRVGHQLPDWRAWDADRILLDADSSAAAGKHAPFDWSLLPRDARGNLVLAGGITPANIASAAALGCGMLDVCSGVEASPGIKDPALMQALFDALRGNDV